MEQFAIYAAIFYMVSVVLCRLVVELTVMMDINLDPYMHLHTDYWLIVHELRKASYIPLKNVYVMCVTLSTWF